MINLLKTIYFNFKMLPLKQAVHLPILFYGRTKFRSLQGCVSINAEGHFGMIRIGINNQYVDTSVPETIWTVNGTIKFSGPMKMARGSYIHVAKNANLSIGTGGSFYGSNLKVMCFDSITIGNCVRLTWDCQIYDTSFHYIEVMDGEKGISSLTSPVVIGNRVWVGNRSTISKGTRIPDDTIIASNSLANKDYTDYGSYILLAGVPAKFKKRGIRRIWNFQKQAELDIKFKYNRHKL